MLSPLQSCASTHLHKLSFANNCPSRCPKACRKLSPHIETAQLLNNSWLGGIRFVETEGIWHCSHFISQFSGTWAEVYTVINECEGKLRIICPDIANVFTLTFKIGFMRWHIVQLFSLRHSFLCLAKKILEPQEADKSVVVLHAGIIATMVCPKYPEVGYCFVSCDPSKNGKRVIPSQQMSRLPLKTKRLARKPNENMQITGTLELEFGNGSISLVTP